MRLVLATLATLALLAVSDLVRQLIPFPEVISVPEQAFSAITFAASTAVGGYIGGRLFIPIAAGIALGLFALVTHLLTQIAAVAEPTTFPAMLVQNWPRAVVPFLAAVLGAWAGYVIAARQSQHVGNEI